MRERERERERERMREMFEREMFEIERFLRWRDVRVMITVTKKKTNNLTTLSESSQN